MSGQTSGWVYRHSPYTGSAFQVHCAIGDSANDAHDYEIWFRIPELAAKARVSDGACRRAVADMLSDEQHPPFLEQLDEVTETKGRPARRFRMLMPDVEAVWLPRIERESQDGLSRRERGVPRTQRGLSRTGRESNIEEVEPKGTQLDLNARASLPGLSGTERGNGHDLAFGEFWKAYPRHAAKLDARKAWNAAIRVAPDHVIVAGARRYRDDPNREKQYTAYPATWLRAGRWDDDPLPERTRDPGGHDSSMPASAWPSNEERW